MITWLIFSCILFSIRLGFSYKFIGNWLWSSTGLLMTIRITIIKRSITFNRALSRKCLYPGLFTNWHGILWMGFVSEIKWNEMKSFATNGNMRLNKTKFRYFKRVTIFRDKHYPNRSVRDALRICCFNITISWKLLCFLSKSIRAWNFVQLLEKNIAF